MSKAPAPSAPADAPSAHATPSEWLEFVGSIVSSIAWPVAILIILFIFRRELSKLVDAVGERIPSMTSVKGFGVEAAWSASAVDAVAQEVGSLPGGPAPGDEHASPDKSTELARIVPSAGVINAFLDVEREVDAYLKRAGVVTSVRRFSPIVELRRSALPQEIKKPVLELSALRNAAAHGVGDISLESAIAYIHTARSIARKFARGDYDSV